MADGNVGSPRPIAGTSYHARTNGQDYAICSIDRWRVILGNLGGSPIKANEPAVANRSQKPSFQFRAPQRAMHLTRELLQNRGRNAHDMDGRTRPAPS